MGENTAAIKEFHEGTKHPGGQLLDPRHSFDPRNRPPRVKSYSQAEAIELPQVGAELELQALDALAADGPIGGPEAMDLSSLARWLQYSNGVTKRLQRAIGEVPFRAAACTGALYHVELYLACGELPGLAAGLYYYQPEAHNLVRLRDGDPRARLGQAVSQPDVLQGARAAILYSSEYWRNAFKYQARAYRHAYWDSGTILANGLLLAAALGWDSSLMLGFEDAALEELLGIDDRAELPIAVLALGEGRPPEADDLGPLLDRAELSNRFRQRWPAIAQAQAATALPSQQAAAAWEGDGSDGFASAEGSEEQVALPEPAAASSPPLEEVIRRRGSSRQFERRSIERSELARVLRDALQPLRCDASGQDGAGLAQPYVLVNAVDGLEAGVYRCRKDGTALARLDSLDREQAGKLALGQALGADAAANVVFLGDWAAIADYGARGYRLAQLEAAQQGGRLYLAAYALGLGASGLTFFDDLVAKTCGRNPTDTAVLFWLALGHPG